jgi:hypothetical protein
MSEKYILKTRTVQIQIIKDVLGMLEGLSSGDIFLSFKKDKNMEKNIDDTDSESGEDSGSESDSKYKKNKKIKKNKKKLIETDSDSDSNCKSKNKKKLIETDSDSDSNCKSKNKKNIQSNGGIIIKTVCSSQTMITMIKLKSSLFNLFYVEKDDFSFWIDIKEINKFIKSYDTDNNNLIMFVTKDDEKTLKFKLTHNEKKKRYKLNEQCFNEPDLEIDNIKNIQFDMSISIDSTLFKKICNDMKKIDATSMRIQCDAEQVIFSSLNKAKKPSHDSYENGDDVIINIINKNKKELKNSFLLEDLCKLKYPSNICNNIIIHLTHKNPLVIHSSICDDENLDHGRILVYLSPCDNDIKDEEYYEKSQKYYKDKKAIMKS